MLILYQYIQKIILVILIIILIKTNLINYISRNNKVKELDLQI